MILPNALDIAIVDGNHKLRFIYFNPVEALRINIASDIVARKHYHNACSSTGRSGMMLLMYIVMQSSWSKIYAESQPGCNIIT